MNIETLISNTNCSATTFPITTLLKPGNEDPVDRLVGETSAIMTDITDEFKTTVTEASLLCLPEFSYKQAGILSLLSSALRGKGGYGFTRAIVGSSFGLNTFVPDGRRKG